MAKGRDKPKGADTLEGDSGPAPQPRPFWSGVIAFGLVSLPVSLFPANRGRAVRLKMVDEDGTALRRHYFCEQEARMVTRDELVRGYPVEEGFVVVKDDELAALAPEKRREIDLRRFVPLRDLDPVYFQRGYFLAPDPDATKAYRLLARSMEDQGRAGIATFVMRDKEYVVAIIAEGGILRAETLRFQDEIRSPEAVGLPDLGGAPKRQVQTLATSMRSLFETGLDPAILSDGEARRLLELVRRKLEQGKDVIAEPEAPPPEEEGNIVDLMEVLKARLAGREMGDEESKKKGSAGTGRRGAREKLESLTREALYARAKDRDIAGRSRMTRDELVEALRKAE